MDTKGRYYVPFDNSWCIDVDAKNLRCALLVPCEANKYKPKDTGPFICITNPYSNQVRNAKGDIEEHDFVQIKSESTGRTYQTLFVRKFLKDDYEQH